MLPEEPSATTYVTKRTDTKIVQQRMKGDELT
jgi:hypothetical protein